MHNPVDRPGPVALVGSGEFLPVMEAVDAGLLAGRPARVIILPTAAAQEGPGRVAYWTDLGTAHCERLGAAAVPLPVLDRDGAGDAGLAAQVAGAGLIYLSGGNPGYLADTLRGSLVLEAVLAAWRGGAALAGCSAGAMALTEEADDVRTGRRRPGLGVVPGLVVVPHFDRVERWWSGVVDRKRSGLEPSRLMVGIDEETALVGGPVRWRVGGRQRVWIFDGPGDDGRAYEPGDEVDLSLRPLADEDPAVAG
jgi:cyanophycinase